MDRNFVISASVAAAFHAGLLFGLPGAPAKPEPAKTNLVSTLIDAFKIFPEPAPPEDAPEKSSALGSPENAAPTLPEVPSTTPSVFTVSVPETKPLTVNVHVSTIPLGPLGYMGGEIGGVGPGHGPGINFTELDGTPRTRSQAAPIYPFEAKRQGMNGDVLVEFMVDESGGVVSPHVVKSSSPMFEEAALRAVARWKFEPGKRGGRVVRFKMAVPIVFNLNDL